MRTSTKSLAAGFCVAGLILAGCGSSSDGASGSDGATSSQSTDDVTITDAWARTSAMGTSTGVVYMEITASEDDELISASVPTSVAATTEIHETSMEDMSEGHSDDGEMTDGEMTDGEMTDGEMTDGEMTDGEMTDDTSTDTTMADGEMADGEMDGEMEGNMTMSQVEAVELPAGETVMLEPGGYHIMLMELAEPLEAGQSVEVTLEFQNAGTKTVTAEVRDS